MLSVGCGSKVVIDKNDQKFGQEADGTKNAPGTDSNANSGSAANNGTDQFGPAVSGDIIAIMKTSMGDIKIRLFSKEAPKTVENFVKHAKDGYYDNLIFHRVINEFMIQGGDPQGNGRGGESIWGKPFEDEFNDNLHNYRGALSMANSGPNTNGSQFFIVQKNRLDPKSEEWVETEKFMKDSGFKKEVINKYKETGGTPWLDNKHTVFGQVIEGMDVVDKIADVKTGANDKPVEDVKILDIELMNP
ncbi:MAG: peptidylprolyl isomerase [Clostridiaceae bacterium]|nr:peptidylprolyl isomerase [Clostridiaceae bacterium]